jgi:predicted RNase H-like HicB family nuclease
LNEELDMISKQIDEEMERLNISEDLESDFNPQLFLIGFAKGLEQKDISSDIEKCAPAEAKVAQAIQTVIADLMQKTEEGVERAIEDAKEVIKAYKESMVTCAP